MSKQDRQGVRTASELERKYNFGQTFAEMMGMISDARDSVDSVESSLRSEITEQVTEITRSTEQIIMSALESYAETSDYEELKQTVQTQLSIMSDEILMNFSSVTEQITGVDGDLQSKFTELYKYISFKDGCATFGDSVTAITLSLNNGMIEFANNGVVFGSWDGDNFYTGNIVIRVTERAQLGNFAFVPRTDGSLMFLKVGG